MSTVDLQNDSLFLAVQNIERDNETLASHRPSLNISEVIKSCDDAQKRSSWTLVYEQREFGGNPFPWEKKGQKVFRRKVVD